MSLKINNSITWVGKIDWEIRKFHGEEYSTHRGSTYNSYLVQDKKTVLIDTVWLKFGKEFVEDLKKVIPLSKIDYVVANHAEVDQAELYQECIKYYANILTPFSMMVDKKIKDVLALNLPVDMICPSHGVIWREDPLQIIKKYQEWANDYQENQITIVYDTMWDSTRRMAEAIARGITEVDKSVAVKLYNIARSDKNDVITEIFKSKAILVGSPTMNRGYSMQLAGCLK
jgi:flavorubredoxin